MVEKLPIFKKESWRVLWGGLLDGGKKCGNEIGWK